MITMPTKRMNAEPSVKNMKQSEKHPVTNLMTQKGKQTLHFLCFMGSYIQQPIDVSIYGVNLRPSTSRILVELFFACRRCTESHKKHVEICGVECLLFNFSFCCKFSKSSRTQDRHVCLFVLWIFWLSMQHCQEIAKGRVENGWSRIRAVSFVITYIELMCNHPFSTLPIAISLQPKYP